MSDDKYNLDPLPGETNARFAVAAAKGVVGMIPGLGPVLSEVINSIIPDQRLDRIENYLRKLQELYSDEEFQKIKGLPDKVALIEEGMFAAGLTPQKDRLDRITNTIAYGLSEEEFNHDKISNILQITKSLSNVDLVILEYYNLLKDRRIDSKEVIEFKKTHANIFPDSITDTNSNNDITLDQIRENSREFHIAQESLKSRKHYLASLSLLQTLQKEPFLSRPSNLGRNMNTLESQLFESVNSMIKESFKTLNNVEYKISAFGEEVLSIVINKK